MTFTIEEMSLMNTFDHSTRGAAVLDILSTIPSVQDGELKTACRTVMRKLESMTDTEFAAIDFTVYAEDENDE